MKQELIECGCCGHYHRADFFGDCRNDDERFTLDEAITKFGLPDVGWIETVNELE